VIDTTVYIGLATLTAGGLAALGIVAIRTTLGRRLPRTRESQEWPRRATGTDGGDGSTAPAPVPVLDMPDPAAARTPLGTQPAVHQGALDDEDTSAYYAALKIELPLDPDEAAWEQELILFRAGEQAAARQVAATVEALLDTAVPGWRRDICDRPGCLLCVHDFAEAMERATGEQPTVSA
jgi:hypothetical protein